jgi:hypothetical protein
MMTLDQARAVIAEHNRGGNPGYVPWVTACATVYQNHVKTRDRRARLTYDGAPTFAQRMEQQRRMRDQPASIPRSLVGNVTEGGDDPESGSGPVRVMQLPGPASAYQILTDANGDTWLVTSADINFTLDPGTVVGDRPNGIRVTDAMWNNSRLKNINQRNREFWGNGRGA